jgi:hypothetical protein
MWIWTGEYERAQASTSEHEREQARTSEQEDEHARRTTDELMLTPTPQAHAPDLGRRAETRAAVHGSHGRVGRLAP